ncbi:MULTISPECIES: DUF2681 domain-containing protein [unclassified Pasteurella]|uniref:DUF2681 domain-containing protein n=1 Tax=unclassified Pasteurella TaxID=2621516 RepID=UPI001073CED0|nr:DUF2681 domain-containing protein [Pasteurella sp. 19428wF3_WM03]TFU50458.1 DUF2681 domain-containing protein [Pasteurella sp. WM03]
MITYLYLSVIFGLAVLLGWSRFRVKHLTNRLEKTQEKLTALEAEKAVAETQVKHFEVRKKNEENTRGSRRDDVIERLHRSGDLRD